MLGLLCVVAVAHFSSARPAELRSSGAQMANSSSATATVHSRRDLWLEEEALFDGERSGFEAATGREISADLDAQTLATRLAERILAANYAHEEILHAAVAAPTDSLQELLNALRATSTASAPLKDALLAETGRALAAPGSVLSLFAPPTASRADILRARKRILAGGAPVASAHALQNYYSIRNGYAGRTAARSFLDSPPASVRRLLIAPSSSRFPTLLDFITAHARAPEFLV